MKVLKLIVGVVEVGVIVFMVGGGESISCARSCLRFYFGWLHLGINVLALSSRYSG